MNVSISEEGSESVSDIAEHFIELLLGVELLVLSQGGIVVSNVLPDFLVESVSQWGNGHDGDESSSNHV
jgi:hypothetical protein